MRKFIVALLLTSWLAPHTWAFENRQEVNAWMNNYYQKPEPKRIPELVDFFYQHNHLNQVSPALLGFLSGVFHDHPEQTVQWFGQFIRMPSASLETLMLALWYSKHPSGKELMESLFSEHPELGAEHDFVFVYEPNFIEYVDLEQGTWVIDALWGKFLATESTASIQRVIQALYMPAARNSPEDRQTIEQYAKDSLVSNARQHWAVMTYCQTALRQSQGVLAQHLQEVIELAQVVPSSATSNPS